MVNAKCWHKEAAVKLMGLSLGAWQRTVGCNGPTQTLANLSSSLQVCRGPANRIVLHCNAEKPLDEEMRFSLSINLDIGTLLTSINSNCWYATKRPLGWPLNSSQDSPQGGANRREVQRDVPQRQQAEHAERWQRKSRLKRSAGCDR